jgi:hypothetical protein
VTSPNPQAVRNVAPVKQVGDPDPVPVTGVGALTAKDAAVMIPKEIG